VSRRRSGVRLPNPGLEVVFVTQMPKIYGEHYEGKVDEKKKNEIYIGKIYIYYVYTDNTENERSDDS
jgi:hypothetical protein